MPNFNSISSGVSEPQVAENRYLPLTGGIALTTVYALTCYTVIYNKMLGGICGALCTPQTFRIIFFVSVYMFQTGLVCLTVE